MRNRGIIRVLSIMEASSVTGPAKNLLAFANQVQYESDPVIEISVVVFRRPSRPRDGFLSALEAAQIPFRIIAERWAGDPRIIPQLRESVRSAAPDIVQTHSAKAHFLARVSGLPRLARWIAFHHGFTSVDLKDAFYNHLSRWSLQEAPHIVTVCRAFAVELGRLGIPASRISVQHNSVEPFSPRPAAESTSLREQLGIPPGGKTLLVIGRLSSEKGHADLIEALALLPLAAAGVRTRLVIVGNGVERGYLEQRARELGLTGRILFTGQQPNVFPYYGMADLFVLPSHSEGSPNVLLEAMAAGLPIVTTAAGGAVELVDNEESALVVPPRSPQALSRAMGRLLADEDLAARLGSAARVASLRHTPRAYAQGLAGVYQAALNSPIGGRGWEECA
jgi:glycosyltransferase involved in cell wall biosynthesis